LRNIAFHYLIHFLQNVIQKSLKSDDACAKQTKTRDTFVSGLMMTNANSDHRQGSTSRSDLSYPLLKVLKHKPYWLNSILQYMKTFMISCGTKMISYEIF